MIQTICAISFTLILIGLAIFQFLLIFGYPLGEYAWGGQKKILTKGLKIGSVFSIFIYFISALIILNRANVVSVFSNDGLLNYIFWFITFYFALGTLVNLASRSKKERKVMTPIAFTLFLLCLGVGI